MAILRKNSRFLNSLLLLTFLFACSSRSHWISDQVHSDKKEYRSAKLSYLPNDPVHGIDLEFLKIGERLNVYLNIHSIPVSPYQGKAKSALLKLEIDGETLRYETYRLEGGQRFLLSEDVARILIESLQNHKDVTLILPGYRSTIRPEDFSSKFNRLHDPSLLQNPFHLPM